MNPNDQPAPREQQPAETPDDANTPLPVGAYCPRCTYDLRGLTSTRCPECGFPLGVVRGTQPRIPWVWRRKLGYRRAYWRTVRLVWRRPANISAEFIHAISYRDANSFRWLTILHAFIPLVVMVILWYFAGPGDDVGDLEMRIWLTVSMLLGGFLTLAAITGLPSYFFHPRKLPIELQNRAVALSFYTCAPLAWTPLSLVFFLCPPAGVPPSNSAPLWAHGLAAGVCLLTLIFWLLNLHHLTRKLLLKHWTIATLRIAFIVLLWLIVSFVILQGIRILIMLAVIYFYSLD